MDSSTRGAKGGGSGNAGAGGTDFNDGSSGGADGSGFVASAYEGGGSGLSPVVAGPNVVSAMFSARMFLVTLSSVSSTLQQGHRLTLGSSLHRWQRG